MHSPAPLAPPPCGPHDRLTTSSTGAIREAGAVRVPNAARRSLSRSLLLFVLVPTAVHHGPPAVGGRAASPGGGLKTSCESAAVLFLREKAPTGDDCWSTVDLSRHRSRTQRSVFSYWQTTRVQCFLPDIAFPDASLGQRAFCLGQEAKQRWPTTKTPFLNTVSLVMGMAISEPCRAQVAMVALGLLPWQTPRKIDRNQKIPAALRCPSPCPSYVRETVNMCGRESHGSPTAPSLKMDVELTSMSPGAIPEIDGHRHPDSQATLRSNTTAVEVAQRELNRVTRHDGMQNGEAQDGFHECSKREWPTKTSKSPCPATKNYLEHLDIPMHEQARKPNETRFCQNHMQRGGKRYGFFFVVEFAPKIC